MSYLLMSMVHEAKGSNGAAGFICEREQVLGVGKQGESRTATHITSTLRLRAAPRAAGLAGSL